MIIMVKINEDNMVTGLILGVEGEGYLKEKLLASICTQVFVVTLSYRGGMHESSVFKLSQIL